ncbi:transcriptional regulatory protein DegU [bacterium MnTg02]|nr:transcriptional regulatory protein DegU [bacterium MnTg02]
MTELIRVVVVDDHPIVREGVTHALNGDPDISVVGEGTNGEDAIRLARDLLPDIVLLDISLPGGGIEAAQSISVTCPSVKIAMLTVSERNDDVVRSLRAGARGYILKGIKRSELIEIMRELYDGGSYVSPGLAMRLLSETIGHSPHSGTSDDPFSALTAREEEILERVAKGLSNKEIALDLPIRETNVKYYMTNVLRKLHVRNRVEAALLAKEHWKSSDV